MAVRRFLCYAMHDPETPVAAIAWDSNTGLASASTDTLAAAMRGKSQPDVMAAALREGFTDALDVLRYNLPYVTSEATEHPDLASALRF